MPIPGDEMVHPGQVISQYTYLVNRKGYVPPDANNLFFIPYFLHLAGDPGPLEEVTESLLSDDLRRIAFLGHRMDMSRLSVAHLRWIVKQVVRLENAVAGGLRPVIRQYLETIGSRCAGCPEGSLIDEVEAEALAA